MPACRCCRPIYDRIGSLNYARIVFVADACRLLEASHPEVVEQMIASGKGLCHIDADGRVIADVLGGAVMWEPRSEASPLTLAFPGIYSTPKTASAAVLAFCDAVMAMSRPFTDLAPLKILEIIGADPTSPVACLYREHVRHVLVPIVRAIIEMLHAESAVVEWPSKEWLKQKWVQ